MCSPTTPRSLIIYWDIRVNGIFVLTALRNGEKTLERRQRSRLLATEHVGANGLYEIHIHTKVNVDQASELRQGLRPLATAHAEVDDFRIYSSATGSTDGNTTKQPKGYVISVISPTKVGLWHNSLGHFRITMFRRMLPTPTGHAVCPNDANKVDDCAACSQGKLIQRPSRWKLLTKLPPRLQRLQGDVCGPINPPSRPFM